MLNEKGTFSLKIKESKCRWVREGVKAYSGWSLCLMGTVYYVLRGYPCV